MIVTNQITTRFGRQATEQGEFLKGIIILLLLLSLLSKLAEVAFLFALPVTVVNILLVTFFDLHPR